MKRWAWLVLVVLAPVAAAWITIKCATSRTFREAVEELEARS